MATASSSPDPKCLAAVPLSRDDWQMLEAYHTNILKHMRQATVILEEEGDAMNQGSVHSSPLSNASQESSSSSTLNGKGHIDQHQNNAMLLKAMLVPPSPPTFASEPSSKSALSSLPLGALSMMGPAKDISASHSNNTSTTTTMSSWHQLMVVAAAAAVASARTDSTMTSSSLPDTNKCLPQPPPQPPTQKQQQQQQQQHFVRRAHMLLPIHQHQPLLLHPGMKALPQPLRRSVSRESSISLLPSTSGDARVASDTSTHTSTNAEDLAVVADTGITTTSDVRPVKRARILGPDVTRLMQKALPPPYPLVKHAPPPPPTNQSQ